MALTRIAGLSLVAALAFCGSVASASEDVGLGPWRLGMQKSAVESLTKFGPYAPVPSTGGLETANGQFRNHKVNTSFVFDSAGLRSIQVWNYEGKDWKAAQAAVLEVFDYFSESYGGAEVRSVAVDGAAGMDRTTLAAVTERILGTAKELSDKARSERKGNMTITFDMLPKSQPRDSRLHCQWIYMGKLDIFYIFVYQDRKDAPSRIAKSNIFLSGL